MYLICINIRCHAYYSLEKIVGVEGTSSALRSVCGIECERTWLGSGRKKSLNGVTHKHTYIRWEKGSPLRLAGTVNDLPTIVAFHIIRSHYVRLP